MIMALGGSPQWHIFTGPPGRREVFASSPRGLIANVKSV